MGNSKNMNLGMGILDSINKKRDNIGDNTNDNTNDISNSTTSDKTCDNSSDITSDTISDIQSDILKSVSKRLKYTDTHVRKTYYFENDLFKKVNKLSNKNNQDNSYIINQALRFFFDALEKVNKK